MRTTRSICIAPFLMTAALSILPSGIAHGALNGKAVTVVQTIVSPFYGTQSAIRSRLIVVNVSNSAVARTDTILREPMLVHPTWSFDGTRIAFYRFGHGIAVVDADGKNLRDVWSGPAFGAENDVANISWPGTDSGKWIYFHKSQNSGNEGTGEIWKVNVNDTAQKSLVCDYLPATAWCAQGACLRRWSLTPDAKYAVIHCYENGNVVPHLFPPQNNNAMLTAPTCVPTGDGNKNCSFWGDCNPSLSASGNILYHFGGAHTQIYANWWNHTPTSASPNTITYSFTIGTGPSGSLDQYKDVETWLAPSAAKDAMQCFIWPRGAANSDKIVTSIVANRYGAEYWHNSCGGNIVVANWKDRNAVMVTNNPLLPLSMARCPTG